MNISCSIRDESCLINTRKNGKISVNKISDGIGIYGRGSRNIQEANI